MVSMTRKELHMMGVGRPLQTVSYSVLCQSSFWMTAVVSDDTHERDSATQQSDKAQGHGIGKEEPTVTPTRISSSSKEARQQQLQRTEKMLRVAVDKLKAMQMEHAAKESAAQREIAALQLQLNGILRVSAQDIAELRAELEMLRMEDSRSILRRSCHTVCHKCISMFHLYACVLMGNIHSLVQARLCSRGPLSSKSECFAADAYAEAAKFGA